MHSCQKADVLSVLAQACSPITTVPIFVTYVSRWVVFLLYWIPVMECSAKPNHHGA